VGLGRSASLFTGNWLRFPADGDTTDEPTPRWPLETVLDAAAAAGFRAVGLDHYTVGAFLRGGGNVNELGDLLRARGLRCTDVGILRIGFDVTSSAAGLAQTAAGVDASVCVAALYAPVANHAAVADIRAAAEILDIRIAFEFTAYGIRRTLREAIEICDAVGWDRCGLLVDTWHMFRGGEDLAALRALSPDQIALVHVNDGPASARDDAIAEGRRHRLPPGEGAFPLDEFATTLDAIGYTGVVSVEVLSDELRRRAPVEGARVLYGSCTSSQRTALDRRRYP
jgi:sugar phosphate isomerase/epimerase